MKKQEIDATNFVSWVASANDCKNVVFQALDLVPHDAVLAALPQASSSGECCVYLGCQIGPLLAAASAISHALVFPAIEGKPYRPFRHSLYTVEELFHGFDPTVENSYRSTPDWRCFEGFIKVDSNYQPFRPVQYVEVGLDEILSRRIHDNFIDDALDEFLEEFRGSGKKGIVAIMGGHDKKRSDPAFKRVASLAWALTRDGYLVASGGGPGFMEAANMGAYFAALTEEELHAAIDAIAVPLVSDLYSDKDWLKAAWVVREKYKPTDFSRCRSLGIPTWFYGHEPPNLFASHIAKYFENSLREEGLLAIATHGVIFADGNGGTVQEIFQDACQNYYDNYGFKSPMVLFGTDYWHPKALRLENDHPVYPDKAYPAWPLLQGLAQKKSFTGLTLLTSNTDEVLEFIRNFKAPWESSGPV